jgi:hypothetical protein
MVAFESLASCLPPFEDSEAEKASASVPFGAARRERSPWPPCGGTKGLSPPPQGEVSRSDGGGGSLLIEAVRIV